MEVAAAKALGAGIAVIALFGVGLGIGNTNYGDKARTGYVWPVR